MHTSSHDVRAADIHSDAVLFHCKNMIRQILKLYLLKSGILSKADIHKAAIFHVG